MMPAIVETYDLTKRYGAITSLRDCTLAVQPGEVFGLLGPNGAGKTTFLRLLLGLLRPSAGRATIDSLDCYQQSLEVRSRTSYLPGEVRMFRQMRGRQFLEFTSRLRRTASLARSLALAERLGLDISRRAGSMSTGMRQKLALSAVLAVDVPLLILDEPTSNLDPTARREVLSLVAEARRKGRTVLFSSHVLAEVEQVCDRVAILRAGELVHVQAMADLRRRHRIHGRVTGPLPQAPPTLMEQMTVEMNEAGELDIETTGPLAPLLGWLATVPLEHVRIETVGLAAVYERFHAPSEEALERHSA